MEGSMGSRSMQCIEGSMDIESIEASKAQGALRFNGLKGVKGH